MSWGAVCWGVFRGARERRGGKGERAGEREGTCRVMEVELVFAGCCCVFVVTHGPSGNGDVWLRWRVPI